MYSTTVQNRDKISESDRASHNPRFWQFVDDDDDDSYLYLHLSMCTCICFIIFLVSKFVYLYSKTQSIGEYCDGEEEEGKENINLNCYQILNSWYVCLFIFPLVISIIITIFIVIWTHCVVSQFHLMFFIPIIIVTFQMCGIIVVESSWYFILFYLMMMMAMMMTMMIAIMMLMKVIIFFF